MLVNLSIMAAIISFLCAWSSAWAQMAIPLSVSEYAGVDRVNEVVTSGVPLPEDAAIFSAGQLALIDNMGREVPSQVNVLARWGGTPDDAAKPIKWVLLNFQANVTANSTAVYTLKECGTSAAAPTSLKVEEDSEKILVDTGKVRFQVSKRAFNLFENVWIDKEADGKRDDLIVRSSASGGLTLRDVNGKIYRTTLESPEEATIEENGPMRAVVKIRGVFKSEDGQTFAPPLCWSANYPNFCQPYPRSYFYYSCRIHFYNNKEFVRVFLTLENNGANGRTNPEQDYAPDQTVYFDSVYLTLQSHGFEMSNVASEASTAQIGAEEIYELSQDWKENLTDTISDTLEPTFENGIYHTAKKNGEQVSAGKTNPGWMAISSGNRQIGVAIKHFWQNFPKKITMRPAETIIHLWPEGGYYPYTVAARAAGTYLFDAGRHKTFEMALAFSNVPDAGRIRNCSKALESPLMALASSEWYMQTKALGMIASSGLTSANVEMVEAFQRFEKLQYGMVNKSNSENGWTLFNIKTNNPPHWECNRQNRFFNWMNFGDLLWAEGVCNLHYDWTYSMLLHYLRSGKREFFEAGTEMAKYRYDVGQYHGDRIAKNRNHLWINHFQFYESGGNADPNIHPVTPSRVSGPTHTWNGGLLVYYLLTGDRKALEAAVENGKGVLNYYGKGGLKDASLIGCPSDEIRSEGWSMLNLINLYRVLGKNEYIDVAKNIAINRLLYREKCVGNGHWGADSTSGAALSHLAPLSCRKGGCNSCENTEWNTMYVYIVEPLVQVHYETGDENLKSLLVRMADFLRNALIYGGDYDSVGKYRPLQSQYLWVEEDADGSVRYQASNKDTYYRGEIVKSLFWPDLFGYVYALTNESEYLNWARKCFKDAVLFYTLAGATYVDPKYRSIISFLDNGFPGTHTKVHGWIGRTNQVYLHVEWMLAQGEVKILSFAVPAATVGFAYTYVISVIGGEGPYTFESIGNLPAGLSLSSTGMLSGTPSAIGNYAFRVRVRDANRTSAETAVTIDVKSPSGGSPFSSPRNLYVN